MKSLVLAITASILMSSIPALADSDTYQYAQAVKEKAERAIDALNNGDSRKVRWALKQLIDEANQQLGQGGGWGGNHGTTCYVKAYDSTGFTYISPGPATTDSYGTVASGSELEYLGERAIDPRYGNGIEMIKVRLVRKVYRNSLDAADGTVGWMTRDWTTCP